MKNKLALFLVLLLMGGMFVSCGPKVFTKGEYEAPEKTTLLTDMWMDEDERRVADVLIRSLVSAPVIRASHALPVLQIEKIANRTSEHIDTQSISDKIRVALLKSGKVAFAHKELRETVAEEYKYQKDSGYVSGPTAKDKGEQVGADYLVSGRLTSVLQQAGDQEIIYYKITLNLTDLKTNLIKWSDEAELKKYFKKQRVSK